MQESFERKYNMRDSNQFQLDQTLATLFKNRDPDVMKYVRKSLTLRHKDLFLDKHTPHMKEAAGMLRPARQTEAAQDKPMEECYSEGHGLSIQEEVVDPRKYDYNQMN